MSAPRSFCSTWLTLVLTLACSSDPKGPVNASGGASGGGASSGGTHTTGQNTTGQNTTGQNTAGQNTAGQNTAGQNTAGQNTAGQNAAGGQGGSNGAGDELSVFVFSRTLGYRHASIGSGIAALTELGAERGWRVQASEDATLFESGLLPNVDVVVFLSTSGDVLNEAQQTALQSFIRRGGGFVGVHSASDTEYDWPWYGDLVGAYFKVHPPTQGASLRVEDADHPATRGLATPWTRTDEWYTFRTNPRGTVNVLLTLDESSYEPGDASMGEDHPIAWYHEFDGGRSFYTALGHTEASYAEPPFRQHLVGAIEWAAGRER